MFSDWAFFKISLADSGRFAIQYENAEGFRHAALAFCVLGTILYLPDLWGFYNRARAIGDNRRAERRNETAREEHDRKAKEAQRRQAYTFVTALVFFLEDLPQLGINSLYLSTLGFSGADPVAIFAFVMSLLSLVLNMTLFVREMRASGPDTRSTCALLGTQIAAQFKAVFADIRAGFRHSPQLFVAKCMTSLALLLAIGATAERMLTSDLEGGLGIWTWSQIERFGDGQSRSYAGDLDTCDYKRQTGWMCLCWKPDSVGR